MIQFKKMLSIVLTICLIAGTLAGFSTTAFAADSAVVTIESFVRGEQKDLRSSELLVAKVEGYDGNVQDLIYEWKSTLGTYLYVYNSHNMYSINNTDGEIEIHNTEKEIKPSENMKGRTYNGTFSGKGYAYASVYGANLSASSSLEGTITVTVKDAAGNVIATDSHVGEIEEKFEKWQWTYTYNGFMPADLQADLDNVSFGIFEGDTKNVKDLLGESAILHITCEECSVTNGKIESGKNYITLSKKGDYYITGKTAGQATMDGDARVTITVEKKNCKFHKKQEGTATTTVYVYKKPIPVPTTTSITLAEESLDSRCRYFIDGVEATTQADGTVIFTGLTPNTDYEIEVVGDTQDTAPAYAYVYTKTLPVFNANIQVYLNGTYDSETATVTSGELVDLTVLGASDNDLFVKKIGTNVFVELVHTGTGSYSVGVENGVYELFYEADVNALLPEQQLTIDGDSRTRYMFYNSVEYDANGGVGAPATDYYYSGNPATVSDIVPVKDGYLFKGWTDENGNVYQANDIITKNISKAYKLTAVWEDAVNVYVNIEINHVAEMGGSHNSDQAKHNITFTVDGRKGADGNFAELSTKEILWDGVSTFNYKGFGARVARTTDKTLYYATEPTFSNMPSDMQYTLTTAKSGYELQSIETTVDENGDVHIDARLIYEPRNFDFAFTAKLDDASKLLPDAFKPVAVNVKVVSWYDSPYDEEDVVGWHHITQHRDTYVKMELDENDEATATFPVWIETTDSIHRYSYRVAVVSYELADGTIIEAKNIDDQYETFITDDERYYAYIDVKNGKDPDDAGVNTLTGAYFDDVKQVGTVTAIVAINVYDVTFNPNGGKFADGTTANKIKTNQIAVPAFADYLPTREGGYTFLGWYLADANGNMTDNMVQEGDILFGDITLIAKWAAPVTVKGRVSVAGSYQYEGSERVILDADRATVVDVLLQKVDANGYAHTIESYQTPITYVNNIGTGSYEFNNIPNDCSSYRIKVMNANYGELYQNENTSSQIVTNYGAYDATHYMAVFGNDTVATVNAYLPFDPKNFPLQYEVDATAVGEGFRPASVDLLVRYNDDSGIVNSQEWPVISQLIAGDKTEDIKVTMTEGIGNGSFDVWASKTDGTDLYEYSITVTEYNGVKDYEVAPYLISYNGSARYSATEGQTHILKATIVPKMYVITYDLNAGEDEVHDMDSYHTVEGVYEDFYYWSYGKAITAKPSRTGYKFLGWYDDNGNQVTEISAAMAEDITLTARWQKLQVESYVNNYAYIFGYTDTEMGAEGQLLRSEASAMVHRLVKQNGKLGDFVYDSSNPSFADIQGEWFQSGIEFMHHKGAFNVEEGGNVQPYLAITRGETFKLVALGLGFTEDTTLSNAGYANLLYELGYIQGDENGDLNIDGMIKRSEFCTMYNRIIGREHRVLIDAEGNSITAETYGFTDLDSEQWYYEEMLRATSAYDDNGFVDVAKRGIRNDLDDYGK